MEMVVLMVEISQQPSHKRSQETIAMKHLCQQEGGQGNEKQQSEIECRVREASHVLALTEFVIHLHEQAAGQTGNATE
jgi:hypothetical protein